MYTFIFVPVILICLAFLIPHQRLTRRLNRVEAAFAPLEDALRTRLDLIAEWVDSLPDADENQRALRVLCEDARDGETDALMKAYPKIEKLFLTQKPERETFEKNEAEIKELGKNYNAELEPYNAMLLKFPWKLYASSLMIKREEKF